MRTSTLILAICAVTFWTTSASAQMTYTTKGGNALIPDALSTVDLPDGNMLVRSTSNGFIWTEDDNVVGGNGALACYGSNTMSPEGEQLDGSGTCEGVDPDGDIWWLWWNGGMEGEFGFTGGTGKYAGITGGGTWKAQLRYPDGSFTNDWEGSWTIPEHTME